MRNVIRRAVIWAFSGEGHVPAMPVLRREARRPKWLYQEAARRRRKRAADKKKGSK